MQFNSYIFILVFLPFSILGYYLLNSKKVEYGLFFLLFSSWWFIGYYNIIYVLILIPVELVNYCIAYEINKKKNRTSARDRKILEIIGIIFNIGLLFVFKYYNFFISNLNHFKTIDIATKNVILPLGISFYSFQQISFIVDCYRDTNIKCSLLEYMTYVSFFPQFAQGPIVFQDELINQFREKERKKIDFELLARGLFRFVIGLSKKVLIADNMALIANSGYSYLTELNRSSSILLVIAYSLQLYYDFSGYSDMAIGIGYMFHITLPENFDSPYKASSIADFWDRWHISLTRFFTKYIYYPLGGSRNGTISTYCNVFIVFLVSGIWHGAEWSFVAWGIFHGLAMVMQKILESHNIRISTIVTRIITLVYVMYGWVFFWAPRSADAISVIRNTIVGATGGLLEEIYEPLTKTVEGAIISRLDFMNLHVFLPGIWVIVFVIFVFGITIGAKNSRELERVFKPTKLNGVITVLLFVWSIISLSGMTSFVYWNF